MKLKMLLLSALLVIGTSVSYGETKAQAPEQATCVSIEKGEQTNDFLFTAIDSCNIVCQIAESPNLFIENEGGELISVNIEKPVVPINEYAYCACSDPPLPAEVVIINYRHYTTPVLYQYSRYYKPVHIPLT